MNYSILILQLISIFYDVVPNGDQIAQLVL